jgi:hypothetical protein
MSGRVFYELISNGWFMESASPKKRVGGRLLGYSWCLNED